MPVVNIGIKTYTLDEIRELCLAYDGEYGNYPESTYEGLALFQWIENGGKSPEVFNSLTHQNWEKSLEEKQNA